MTFRDDEKRRYEWIKHELFSPEACEPGRYNGIVRPFCLADDRSSENLHASIRDRAITYFAQRRIPWHKGLADAEGGGTPRPSNHLCCSQTACVNALWPLAEDGDLLARVFRPFFPDLDKPLPFEADDGPPFEAPHFLAFEWIDALNRLGEKGQPHRGANATSADFAFRFLRTDGRSQLVLGEWKYTEEYGKAPAETWGTNLIRMGIYREAYHRWVKGRVRFLLYDSLFAEPFYQLMRQSLMVQEMELPAARGEPAFGANIVSVVHVSPKANHDFSDNLSMAPTLATRFGTVTEAWKALAPEGRFLPLASEDLLESIHCAAGLSHADWSRWLLKRYGWWREDSKR